MRSTKVQPLSGLLKYELLHLSSPPLTFCQFLPLALFLHIYLYICSHLFLPILSFNKWLLAL